jgi:lipoprotein-anchoring transpeptidase ErfK/SrfK
MAAAVVLAMVAAAKAMAQEKAERSGEVRKIVVSIPDRKLALLSGDRVVKTYDVAVGASKTRTPAGTFTIVNRLAHPAWYGQGKVVPAGPSNPLGTRWMGLSIRSLGIHGTNVARSIGKAASHGCIRMRNADIEDLFELARVGDAVEIHGERSADLARIFPTESAPGAVQQVQVAMAASAAGGAIQ